MNKERIEELIELLRITPSYRPLDQSELFEMYDECLNDCHVCDCGGNCYCDRYAEDLKGNDPNAYRSGFADWTEAQEEGGILVYINDEYVEKYKLDELLEDLLSAVENLF